MDSNTNFHHDLPPPPPPPPSSRGMTRSTEEMSRRRVSISEQVFGLDNPGFEHNRRISASSEHNSDQGRRKSILHYGHSNGGSVENIQQYKFEVDTIRANGNNRKKSAMSLSSSVRDKIEYSEELKRSWLYVFCAQCHGRDDTASWEPPGWRRACPQPFCPSYRKFARTSCLFLMGLLIWGIVYCIIGRDAAPGGPLFSLAALSIAAHFGGWIFSLTTLPALIGMLVTGIVMQNAGLVDIGGGHYGSVISNLRKIALVIILTRAGLDLDPNALKRQRITVPKLGLIPWLVEAAMIGVTSVYLIGLPWIWGFLIGSVIAAVSPAVVVPCLFRLRGKGYGVAKGIPTLIIAIAGIDDAASVAIFGIVKSVMFSQDALWYQILQGPISIIGGIGFGVLWGCLAKYVPEKGDPFVIPMRVLMLLGGGLLAVFGSEAVELGGAGPLAVVAAAFVSCYFWQEEEGWEVDENPVAIAFEIFWMIFEPILFGLTGAQIKISELEGSQVYLIIGCLMAGIIVRILVTVLVGIGSKFNLKEKVFIALACMAKATVQAALGPVALDEIDPAQTDQLRFAETALTFCVLSILLTAPAGGVIITLSGPKLLTKTTAPIKPQEGWRSRRPSIRDISIINEDPDLEESAANKI
ncbi:sodium/hydrogen exchanger 9B2 [Venturia canescens]|uniref:sodium/hydrogen exchanger 9B2 n=1 Tax=Venturia canescens TaxID=32260 RepID=UPI001C9C01A4|nr:sodium/hydrogen exchanger 9B2 [Venturia canescens]